MSPRSSSRRFKPPSLASLRRGAVAYVRRYPTTSGHLRRVLRRRIDRAIARAGGDREEALCWAEAVVEELVAAGFVDDGLYVQARVRELHRRGTSRLGIRAKLAAKAADPALVEAALQDLAGDDRDLELVGATAYARRRGLGPFRRQPDPDRLRRDLAAVVRAGFPFPVAKRVIEATDSSELPPPE